MNKNNFTPENTIDNLLLSITKYTNQFPFKEKQNQNNH